MPVLRLTTSAGGLAVVTDGGAGDLNTSAGAVTFSGSLAGWTVNVTTGLSRPAIGNGIRPRMDLNSINVSGGSGTITIQLTDNNWSLGVNTTSVSSIGGVSDGAVSYTVFTGAGNGAFENTTIITSQGVFGGAFSGTQSGTMAADGSFSITQQVIITHASLELVSSFNAGVEVPEPGTLAILGIGLVGLGFVRRRRQKRIAA